MTEPWPSDSVPTERLGGDALAPAPEDRNFAMAAHLGAPVTAWFALGVIAPLIVLVLRGRTPWVRRHAVESLNFNLNALVWGLLGGVLTFVTFGAFLPVLIAYGVFYLVCVVLGAVRASRGRTFRYPLTFRFVS